MAAVLLHTIPNTSILLSQLSLRGKLRQAESWDPMSFTAMLAHGPMSSQATKYKETIRDWK